MIYKKDKERDCHSILNSSREEKMRKKKIRREKVYLEFISDSASPLVFSLHILQLAQQLLSGQLGGGQLLLRVGGQELAQLA